MPSEWASAAGAEHRLGRAAGLGAVGLGVGPELDRDRDHLGPPLALEQRGDGAVDAAGHGDGDALWGRGDRRPLGSVVGHVPRREHGQGDRSGCARAPGAGRRRRAGRRGAWPASGRRARRRRRRCRARAASSTGAPSTISATAAVAAAVAPQPSASKLTEAIRPSSTMKRDPREIAAGGAARGAREGAVGRGPAPALVAQVVLEELSVHRTRVGGPPPAAPTADLARQVTREQRSQGRPRSLRFVAQLPPGDPHRAPALGEQDPVALRGRSRRRWSVPCTPRPSSSTSSRCGSQRQSSSKKPPAHRQRRVEPRPRQARARRETPRTAPRTRSRVTPTGSSTGEQPAQQLRDPAPPRIALAAASGNETRSVSRLHLHLVAGPLQLPRRFEHRRQVEDRPKRPRSPESRRPPSTSSGGSDGAMARSRSLPTTLGPRHFRRRWSDCGDEHPRAAAADRWLSTAPGPPASTAAIHRPSPARVRDARPRRRRG